METSLKTSFAQIFSCCPNFGGGCSPPRPPGPYAYALSFNRKIAINFILNVLAFFSALRAEVTFLR